MGNPASLDEESHAGQGLLEYPVYTKPPTWRGRDVPEVLLSGDHARIAAWRRQESLNRTAARRPDLLHPSQAVAVGDGLQVRVAVPADAPEILVLQLACWVSEARANESLEIPPLREDLADVQRSLHEWTTFVVRSGPRLVASVRGRLVDDLWEVGRLMVAPDLRGRGLGRWLLDHVERAAPPQARRLSLVTGARSLDNLRMYRRAGYRRMPAPAQDEEPGVVRLGKPVPRP
jgi:tRNA (guanine37-N1)-methyltransferase